MAITKLLVANRGEVAIRVMRAAAELDINTVAVFSEDDMHGLHIRRADESRRLRGRGATAYLDVDQLLAVARETGCDAVHPGYGFLSERAEFARRCEQVGLAFVGPRPDTLELLGDKARARELASELDVPVLPGTPAGSGLEAARAFFESLGASASLIFKAVAGGGGRGMRVVRNLAELEQAYARCSSEAKASFGDARLYAEQFIERARHIEVQVVGDGTGVVTHLWDRECSVQRRHQKLIEIAPSPHLPEAIRERLLDKAVRLAQAACLRSLATFEFLLDVTTADAGRFVFIEANPRLQVEHTVTEEVTGLDLVKLQLGIAEGKTLQDLGLDTAQPPRARGYAIQLRINMETMAEDGSAQPSGGTLSAFEVPMGPGVRVDTLGYAGYTTSPHFDSLLAKVIVHSAGDVFAAAVRRGQRALGEFHIGGVDTNLAFLGALLRHEDFRTGRMYTRFVEDHAAALLAGVDVRTLRVSGGKAAESATALPGALVAVRDPLAVLAHGKSGTASEPPIAALEHSPRRAVMVPEGMVAVRAPMQGTIVNLEADVGVALQVGAPLIVMEAMKMEHVLQAPVSGVVRSWNVAVGDTVAKDHVLLLLEPRAVQGEVVATEEQVDLDFVRHDLAEVLERHAYGSDERRHDAVVKRRARGCRTARENIADLVDAGSFVEYGPLVIAAQRRRRSEQELIERTSADGLVAGVGRVNGGLFDESRTQCVVMSYDYMVMAGTQGVQNHRKKDRMFELAERQKLPVVFFTEGGGGRPGDTDGMGFSMLDCLAFWYFGRLSGLVPLVGIANGRCFAGNAALLGCCDIVIATEGTNIGMGGPAMIEGGGLGLFRPEEVGPMDVQVPNGVVDVLVKDEAEAVRVAKQYLGYFQGTAREFQQVDARLLRTLIPENRLRVYDVRRVIETLADVDSVLELRREFGLGMVTALARVEGRPLGIIANNPTHLSGAIDRDGADKAARFMQLCDAYDIPILFLCDTPGIMVGPESEKTALVRHVARVFVTAASLSVPFFTIVLRKGYGLGAQLMAGGSFKAPVFTVAWPTAELGAMGLEGAVKLGFRKELEAIQDPEQRKQTFDGMVQVAYAMGKGVNVASHFELDDVIDPADSRKWILSALRAAPALLPREGKKRPCVDTW